MAMNLASKTPTHRHWEGLKIYLAPIDNTQMELDEFLRQWNVSREELAFICDCSLTTVNHWFSQGVDCRTPSEKHKQRMAFAHHIWIAIETEPQYLQTLRQMYNQQTRRHSL
ncbi:hypothetical protein VB834_15050 [Limnoraphis robusta Tam1]|uniref:hypothetical protein n=1 Tax=Limnoraphis robusta TaxID=1118279 RepID=UPI002B1FF614|nr:hypothetical protein [Limnoraphis robusta]MEA5498316.1 hypothetical protein [Limnoraphis robusta BA-68 BA1]MEA5540341.1 hypothetical protein [Limnoraphis robusta Tam1]